MLVSLAGLLAGAWLLPRRPARRARAADLVQALSGQWLGDNGPLHLKAASDPARLAAQLGEMGPTLPLAFQGGTRFVVGDEDVVRFVVDHGRCDLAQEYVGGLFASATRRVAP